MADCATLGVGVAAKLLEQVVINCPAVSVPTINAEPKHHGRLGLTVVFWFGTWPARLRFGARFLEC